MKCCRTCYNSCEFSNRGITEQYQLDYIKKYTNCERTMRTHEADKKTSCKYYREKVIDNDFE
jgi:hypothetical protein